ncbi:MAG: hypothetical protein A7316_06975 [Candidatus Altiarchaeales archaeon WOR_SM1_86-2]|nr:MAG: hypothetical protein A7316_06975 [Candidatus Altiarchaeales archaeon WOR_SM1_86-2]
MIMVKMKQPDSERTPTGIYGFDDLSLGGLRKGRSTLLYGKCGVGKTVFCTEYLHKGATEYGENGIYVTDEELSEDIRRNAGSFGWDFKKLEDEGKLAVIETRDLWITDISDLSTEYGLGKLLKNIKETVKEIGAKRVVIDTIWGLLRELREPTAVRRGIFKIMDTLEKLGCTSILTSEIGESGLSHESRTAVFLADGVISMHRKSWGAHHVREMEVEKMRSCEHIFGKHPFFITPKGIFVFPLSTRFIKYKKYGLGEKKGRGIERTSIDLPKFMNLLSGKLPRGYNILLSGGVGTNASSFAQSMLYDGLKKGESCLLVNTHQPSNAVREFMAELGMDTEPYESDAGKLLFFDDYVGEHIGRELLIDIFSNPLMLGYIMDRWWRDKKPEHFRWSINSLTVLIGMSKREDHSDVDVASLERFLYDRVRKIRDLGGLGIYTINEAAHSKTLINQIRNMMDMVIDLEVTDNKTRMRIAKSRGVISNPDWHPYEIVKGEGIVF